MKSKTNVLLITITLFTTIVAIIFCCLLNFNKYAHADPIPSPGDSGPSGNCSINDTWMVGNISYFNVSFYDADLQKYAGQTTWVCDDYTAAAPSFVGASFTSTVSEVHVKEGYVVYNVYITPPGATDGKTRDPSGRLYGYQHVRGYLRVDKNFTGNLEVHKQSENADLTNSNSLYSLEGVRFGVYNDATCTSLYAECTTNINGVFRLDNIPVATYFVKEIQSSEGYRINSNVLAINIEAGTTVTYTFNEPPRYDQNFMVLHKRDLETSQEHSYGDASFSGAQYAFDYYDGQYTTYNDIAKSEKQHKRSWILKSDDTGRVGPTLGDAYKVSGDNFYKNNGAVVLPLGTYLIYEHAAPEGYLLSNKKYIVRVIKNDSAPYGASAIAYNADTGEQISTGYDSTYKVPYIVDDEQIIRGSVEIEKRDIESKLLTTLGAGVTDGIEFNITNLSKKSVIVANNEYGVNEVCSRLIIDKGKASLVNKALPYGTYQIQEIKTTDSYLLTDGNPRTFQIRNDGQVISYTGNNSFFNQVKRGDYKFVKVSTPDMHPMPKVPFKITSQTTGEWHVLVTDKNGQASTENTWKAHSENTNINDLVLTQEGAIPESGIDETKLNCDAGIWFGKTTEGNIVQTKNNLCALPYDNYVLEELPVNINKGHKLITRLFSITRNNYCVDGGTIDDDPEQQIEIATSASNTSNESKFIECDQNVSITDKIVYSGLKENTTYKLVGEVYDTDADKLIDGLVSEKVFSTVKTSGFEYLRFDFDASLLENHLLVVVEKLYDVNDSLIVEHNDLSDKFQTVKVKDKPKEPTPDTPKFYLADSSPSHSAKTGDMWMIVVVCLCAVVLVCIDLLYESKVN